MSELPTARDLEWSQAEKKLARAVFDAAVQAELAEILAELKRRAAAAQSPNDMWEIRDFLARRQREVDRKYDYRYGELIYLFGLLVREKRVDMRQLEGLTEEKRTLIWRAATL